jgi:hypothetical protein
VNVTKRATLKPTGQRPRCLHCDRELRPRLRREKPPLNVPTGKMITVRAPHSYGPTTKPEYEEVPCYRPMTDTERRQWTREHPAKFLGVYGDFGDNRFCGLRCGYEWALAHSKEAR